MDAVQITPEQAAAAQAVKDGAAAAAERPAHIPEKFWKDGKADYEAMGKAYGELEAKQSQATVIKETPAPVTFQPVPGVTQDSLAKYAQEIEGGALSDVSYSELLKAGYAKETVDAYVKGRTAPADQAKAVADAVIADKEITAIKGTIGGDAGLKTMLDWARTGLTAGELKEYNAAVESGEVSKVKMAVNGLHALYQKETGKQPELIGGRPAQNGIGEVYESKEQMIEDMRDKRYAKDPAFRAMVGKKLNRSKII